MRLLALQPLACRLASWKARTRWSSTNSVDECERLDKLGKVQVIWHPPPEAVELPPDHTLILFRLFQESVHNVLKHANARTVEVRVAGTPRPVLEVRDDGKGFDPAHVANSGQGLRNLDRRARMIGYYCDVISAPGKGTLIRIHP